MIVAATDVLLTALFPPLFLIALLPWGNCPLAVSFHVLKAKTVSRAVQAYSQNILVAKTVVGTVLL